MDHARLPRLSSSRLRHQAFDRFASYAAQRLRCDVGLVTVIAPTAQYFIGAHGLGAPLCTTRQTPLSHAICPHVAAMDRPLMIDNCYTHPLVRDSKAVTELGVTSYLGCPIHYLRGTAIGALCVVNWRARQWRDADRRTLSLIALLVDKQLARALHDIADRSSEAVAEHLTKPIADQPPRRDRPISVARAYNACQT